MRLADRRRMSNIAGKMRFVDDGYPDARDYDNNYVVVAPAHRRKNILATMLRAVWTRLRRAARSRRRS